MKKSDITVCAVKPVAPPDLGLDLPISERENFLKILNHAENILQTLRICSLQLLI